MPFTLSHAAAALPFRRARLVTSALLIGTFAPDLEYFIRLQAGGGWGHTLTGAFALDLPLGLATLWLFHRFVKVPLAYLLPDSVRARLTDELTPFAFGPPLRFLHIVLSMLIGIATHFAWDSVTHENYWLVQHVGWLHHHYHFPGIGWWGVAELLQIVSSIAGLLILAVWCWRWYRRTEPNSRIPVSPFSPHHRHVIVAMGVSSAAVAALIRAWVGLGSPTSRYETDAFIDQVVVTFGALVWWQLAIWGLLGPFRRTHRIASEEETYAQSRASLER